ncbi:MAG: nucleotidyltransferase family protein [Bacteroidales bacterium]|nr:nucleotidyltransferase family protein [Bacteroidales bacterium]
MNSLNPKLRSEEELLLELCRLSFNSEQKNIIRELVNSESDWDYFIRLANEHGIVSSTYHSLEQLDLLSEMPENIKETLRALYLKSLARNTFLAERFIDINKTLADIGIEPVVLKGMALEPFIYENRGLRQMTDIDLHIPGKDDCINAWKHLKDSGYITKPLKSRLYKKLLADFGKHMPDLYKDGISIDLHHSLFDIEHRIEILSLKTDRAELLVPDHDIHFLFLAKHLADHESNGESQLRLYLDLVQLFLRHGEKTGAKHLVSLAKKLDIEDVLIEKLFLLNLFWNVPVEGEILGKISPERKARATSKFIDFLRNPKGNTGRNRGAGYRKTLRNIPTMRKKLLFILGDIFPSITFMQNRYGTKTRIGACVYYPLRFGKLLLLIRR